MVSVLYMTKVAVARVLTVAMVCDLLFWMQKKVLGNNYIRAINYHDTPSISAQSFEKHLQFYQLHFSPVSLSDLDSFFDSGKWIKDKPGLIISFDDGYESNYDVAASLLQKYGFTGWFFVPVNFISTTEERKDFADKPTMSWDELRELDREHVIGCHTGSHHRMTVETTEPELTEEIAQAKFSLEKELNHAIDIFCWCGGDRQSYSSAAARYIEKTGYRYSFMTNSAPILANTEKLHLQRTNIEAHWPVELVKFQLSGIIDILYTRKRTWVNKITTV